MSISVRELQTRQRAMRKIVEDQGLAALILVGDTSTSPGFCGDLRYITNSRVIYHRQAAVIFPGHEPVLFTLSPRQRDVARNNSMLEDCRASDDLLGDITNLLREQRVSGGCIGLTFDMLPAAWYVRLRQEFPRIEWVDSHHEIMQLRLEHSPEEAAVYRAGAALADGEYEVALKALRPGATEYEVVGEIEHYGRTHGVEEHFTLIGSGRFSLGADNGMASIAAPSFRNIEKGDSVVMEITPRYGGYWTQLVRTVTVGTPNLAIERIHKVAREAINIGVEKVRPGVQVKEIVLAMEPYVASSGFLLRPPSGHLCGLDLIEGRVSRENEMVLRPWTAVIIHPLIFTPDGKSSFFWGETYLVTEDGCNRLHRATDGLLTVS